MTAVVLVRAEDGTFASLEAKGHAGTAVRGFNVVCAAVTMLLRTSLDVLEHTDGISVKSEAPERGMLSFCVEANGASLTEEQKVRLSCVADYLELGLKALCKEYPKDVSLETVIR
mgnify:CR=1 FL=1